MFENISKYGYTDRIRFNLCKCYLFINKIWCFYILWSKRYRNGFIFGKCELIKNRYSTFVYRLAIRLSSQSEEAKKQMTLIPLLLFVLDSNCTCDHHQADVAEFFNLNFPWCFFFFCHFGWNSGSHTLSKSILIAFFQLSHWNDWFHGIEQISMMRMTLAKHKHLMCAVQWKWQFLTLTNGIAGCVWFLPINNKSLWIDLMWYDYRQMNSSNLLR